MSAQDTEPELNSHPTNDDHEESSIRRTNKKRKVLSCFPCRDRKMKCDRVYPICGRCQKTERREQCTYDPRLLDGPRPSATANAGSADASLALSEQVAPETYHEDGLADTLRWKVRVQERRIEMLERKLAAKESIKPQSQYQDHLAGGEPKIEEETMLRGKGFKTLFHGSTSVRSMIAHDHALKNFMNEALAMDQSLLRMKRDFKAIRDRKKVGVKEEKGRVFGMDAEVFAALPEKTVVDMHVSAYFQTWGTTYRILHEPSFLEDYHNFWKHTPGDYSQATFAAMLVLIIANTKCLAPKDDVFVDDASADRESASNFIKLYDSWFSRQTQKRYDLLFSQLQCMALLTKRVNCIQLKQDWVASGGLVRLAIASGMHRNPSILTSGKTSEFEKEMKRRLWAIIMELELQSSLESGLQSSLGDLYFDTPAPANLSDDALGPGSQYIPASSPVDNFTPMSFLAVASESLPFRVRLTQLLNNPTHGLQYEDVLRYDTQLHTLLSSLPSWIDDCRATTPSALLKLQLYQYLLIIHRPYAKLSLQNQRFMYSFSVCVEVASSIVSLHDDLISKGILALNNLHNDMLRVGIILSQIVYRNCVSNDSFSSSVVSTTQPCLDTADQTTLHTNLSPAKDSAPSKSPPLIILPQKSFLARTLCISSIELLDRTRHIFEQKLMRLGTGYMEYWLLSVAIIMLSPPPASPNQPTFTGNAVAVNYDRRSKYREAVDSFWKVISKVMAKQKNPDNEFASSLRDAMKNTLAADTGIETDLGATFVTTDNAPYSVIPNLAVDTNASATLPSAFDTLEDTQLILQDWEFPDIWEFDLTGYF